MLKEFSIGLILPPAHFSPAAIMRGVGRYAAQHVDWRVTIATEINHVHLKRFIHSCDGIIAILNPNLRPLLTRPYKPTVGYLDDLDAQRIPVVVPDEGAIGTMGAEHLLERGYERFGFYGLPGNWSRGREEGFVRRLARMGLACQTTATGPPPGTPITWEQLSRRSFLPRWIKQLTPPAAIMAANDDSARDVIDACQRIGLRVPEDIAVLGVDNDELICNYGVMGISSVDRNLERIGLEAARLLHRVIDGNAARDEKVVVPPGPLVTRQSTEAYAINDPDAAAAARFIHDHGCDDIDVTDVLKLVPVSRRALERKLMKAVGRTPAQEIKRVRLARVCELLTQTDLSLADIAAQCGFQYRTYLSLTFKKVFGETPRQYRTRTRQRL